MRALAIAVLSALALTLAGPASAASHKTLSLTAVPHYPDLADAHKACGEDPVAWANLRTRVYHLSGSRWFGKTKHGAYFCKGALDQKGVRQSKE